MTSSLFQWATNTRNQLNLIKFIYLFQCIASTTTDGYRKYTEEDPAFMRLFGPVVVPEPSVEKAIDFLNGPRQDYERHHRVRYSDKT